MVTRTIMERIGWAAAGVLIVAGVATVVVGLAPPVDLGWFAYQPLANEILVPGSGGAFISRVSSVGFIVFTLGLVALAFLTGWRLGRGRRPGFGAPPSGNSPQG